MFYKSSISCTCGIVVTPCTCIKYIFKVILSNLVNQSTKLQLQI